MTPEADFTLKRNGGQHLVVIGVAPPRDRIRVTLRYDRPPGPGLAAGIAAHAVAVLNAQRLTAAVAVAYGPQTLVTPAADGLRDAAGQAGIDLREFLRVQDGRYWSCTCGNQACCPAAGVPFEPDPQAAQAAALIGAGTPVLASRAAVAARVAPLGGIAAEPMRQATRRAEQHVARLLAKVSKSGRIGAARHMIAAEGLAAVGQMITRYRGGGRFTSDYQIARITVALRDLRIRDDAWARMDPAHADAHLRLWTDVTRRAQPGHVAAPAALLALAAWQPGHSTTHARPTRNGSDSTISRSGRQGPPLPDTDLAQAAGSNFPYNIVLGTESTGFVEDLVRLEAEAAVDDIFHDLGGAAEALQNR